ncbi:hypothetical protein [Nonomuraea endophytica]|uniref:Uncharacterized protein n=1 Tax=Nonomuraea endophytica TaxID=714136 RepID=A0A7W8EJ97_9ACTN|nr:hypothetical protein [Nonomuraea endophytica]MBB5081414.1 hypothetical protein [Nonomuraea endophytica]
MFAQVKRMVRVGGALTVAFVVVAVTAVPAHAGRGTLWISGAPIVNPPRGCHDYPGSDIHYIRNDLERSHVDAYRDDNCDPEQYIGTVYRGKDGIYRVGSYFVADF